MKYFRSGTMRVCMQVIFLSALFWVGCRNVAYAQGLVTDCGSVSSPSTGCGWNELLQVVRNVINFVILLAAPCAALAFMWAGVLYFTAAGNESQIKKAHTIFTKVLIGFVIVLSAWLIVWTILNTFANSNVILLVP